MPTSPTEPLDLLAGLRQPLLDRAAQLLDRHRRGRLPANVTPHLTIC
jgi:hypothetical protein